MSAAIKWDAFPAEMQIIVRIAKRARDLAKKNGIEYDFGHAVMDLEACHCNGTPLRLAALEDADDANFGHDVFGIRRFLNRETGQLGSCFIPRFAVGGGQ